MKKSEIVTTSLLTGGVLLAMLHHGTVYRDEYRNQAECQRDWAQHYNACENSHGSGSYASTGRVFGPSYESGARPHTPNAHLALNRQVIKRSGFGFSGARFSAGG